MTAYAVGFAAMIPFFSTGLYTGPVAQALGGGDIAMVIGLPVATLVYLLGCCSLDLKAEGRAVALADRDLEIVELHGRHTQVCEKGSSTGEEYCRAR
ncbi:MAG: hypothetical protein WDN69_22205 [Aliidongia sp.]